MEVTKNTYQITAIKQATRNQNRVNIFLNDEYDFSLDIAQLADFKLKVGQTLTEEEADKYRAASKFGKLYQRTLEWVLTRPHSIKETKDYLKRKNTNFRIPKDRTKPVVFSVKVDLFDKKMGEEVVQKLIDKGFLDDEKFANFYVENRFTKKGISQKRLKQELVKKGVDKTIIEQALSKSSRTEADEIKKIIAKKRNKYDDTKLIQYLVRQGFDYQIAKNSVLDEKD